MKSLTDQQIRDNSPDGEEDLPDWTHSCICDECEACPHASPYEAELCMYCREDDHEVALGAGLYCQRDCF